MPAKDVRPNPEDLLARVREEKARASRGRLKIFFGASAGVGKTYAMLQAAHAARKGGADVVAGYIETHGRSETDALVQDLEVLPRRMIDQGGSRQTEFDLDAALARHPEILLVDELAHTNALGSRHSKRWQDVMELIEAGISVFTTLNVQHLESLNDVVAQVTGVMVRETLPDATLDEADEIELIDLPAEQLLQRLEQGKVYIPEQAHRAAQNFFRPGNLIALREMALRKTAEHVDAQMRDYRRSKSIGTRWPVHDRLMVCVGPSPYAAQLVRATARIASRLDAPWTAVFVDTPSHADAAESTRAAVLSVLRLAEQLGGDTVTLTSANISDSLIRFARTSNVTTLVMGRPKESAWTSFFSSSLLDDLIRQGAGIDIHIVEGDQEPQQPANLSLSLSDLKHPPPKEYLFAAAVVTACTIVSILLRSALAPANLVMVYLLGITAIAMRSSRRVAFLASGASVAAFDFFCVPPYFTFGVSDYEYTVTFVVMLTVALTISGLATRARRQVDYVADREARTQALYRFSRELANETKAFDVARTAARLTEQAFQCPVMIVLPENGRIRFRRRTTDQQIVPSDEEAVAQWVFDHDQKAGKGTNTLSGSKALYLPLTEAGSTKGVMVVVASPDLTSAPEQVHQLEVFAAQTAVAMARIASVQSIRDAEVRMRTEEMRSSLLSAVSHDLRTPLASITGAATSLLDHGDRFSDTTRKELLESIADEAHRLARLVNNLLEMTRLDSRTVEIHRDWHSLEEIVGATLRRLEKELAIHPIKTSLPATLPLVYVDDVLIEHALVNLLENAAKYTPSGTEIEIAASASENAVQVEVRDRGPGFIDGDVSRVFEKFYRGRTGSARGVGLGLAISQAIMRAHGGNIEAENRPDGGAIVRFSLPSTSPEAVR